MARYYHGTAGDLTLHLALCLTDDPNAAGRFADQYRESYDDDPDSGAPTIHTVDLDLTGLTVVELDETWDSQPETADTDAARFADAGPGAHPGVDVLIYNDYALGVEQMTTVRVLSRRALAACQLVGSEEI